MTTTTPRTWLVTGSSRGLGRAMVEAALDAGDVVVATARDCSALADLDERGGSRLIRRDLDVTDRTAVLDVVRQAVEETGRIDVLVNNAGYGLAGAVEEVSEPEARDQMEVNVFGALWCTQAVLPYMREQRSGHIVQISSIGGVISYRNTGVYHATKYALEGFSDSLAQEVDSFGIRVTMVEPGPFRTEWNGASMVRATPMAAYDEVLSDRREALSGAEAGSQPGDPARAAATIVEVVASDKPPLRLLLGRLAADLAPARYEERLSEWASWYDVAVGADFPR